MTIAVMIIKLLIWLPEPTSLRHVKPEPLSPTWSAPKVGIAGARACNELFSIKKLRARQQLALFIENSPIFWVERVQTPYLTIHNDEDDDIPWF